MLNILNPSPKESKLQICAHRLYLLKFLLHKWVMCPQECCQENTDQFIALENPERHDPVFHFDILTFVRDG